MNKNLISQITVCLCAILLIATVTFAWFTISNTANAGFVAQVGDLESSFEFAAVENDKLVDASGVSTLDMKDVIPGQKFYFIMKVQTKGATDGKISIMLNDIKSYNVTGTSDETIYNLNENYTDKEYEKIQYAFSYSITGAYWVPMNEQLDKEVDQSDPTSLVKDTWIEFSPDEKTSYYPTYDEGQSNCRFNKEETKDGTLINQDDYILMKNVIVKGANATDEDKTAEDHNAFVVIFEIDFLQNAVLPSFVKKPDNFDLGNSNVYETQLFSISNITIITSEIED